MPRTLIAAVPPELSERVREQLRRLLMHFDELRLATPGPGFWYPSVDLGEMPDAIVVRVELPGIKKEHLHLSIHDNVLKIQGHKQRISASEDLEEGPRKYLCLERSFGSFERTIALQWSVEVELISARLDNGVLEIRLPKTLSCGREIEIPLSD